MMKFDHLMIPVTNVTRLRGWWDEWSMKER